MSIREFLTGFKDNLLSMEVKSKSFVVMISSMVLLSMIFTPLLGIPGGLVIGVYMSTQS